MPADELSSALSLPAAAQGAGALAIERCHNARRPYQAPMAVWWSRRRGPLRITDPESEVAFASGNTLQRPDGRASRYGAWI